MTITICSYGCESVNSPRLCCPFCLLPNTWKIQQMAKTAKIFLFFLTAYSSRGLYSIVSLCLLVQAHNFTCCLYLFPFSPHAFDFFSMLQLFTLTLNGLVMCMRGRTNTWWQAGINPLVNSRWKAKWPVWSKCVRISPSLPFIVSGTFSWHFYRYEKQFEGLATSALACSTLSWQ